jgi:hypothetical protein
MSYNKSPFTMAPKSPIAKALKGNQENLNAGLKAAIEAAAESPAKQTTGKKEFKNPLSGKPVRQYKAAMVHPPKLEKKVSLPPELKATKTRVKKSKGAGKPSGNGK